MTTQRKVRILDLMEENIPALREYWKEVYSDLFRPVPNRLPLYRAVNHQILLIDSKKVIRYRLPKCPDALKPVLAEKIKCYTDAGWWEPTVAQQVIPMLCLFKKALLGLRTVFDLCE